MEDYKIKKIKGKTFREWESLFEKDNFENEREVKKFFQNYKLKYPFEGYNFDFNGLISACGFKNLKGFGIDPENYSIHSDLLQKTFNSVNHGYSNRFMLNLAVLFFLEEGDKRQLEFDF